MLTARHGRAARQLTTISNCAKIKSGPFRGNGVIKVLAIYSNCKMLLKTASLCVNVYIKITEFFGGRGGSNDILLLPHNKAMLLNNH